MWLNNKACFTPSTSLILHSQSPDVLRLTQHPIPGESQGQVGWGPRQPELLVRTDHVKGLEIGGL